jgi:hypothetical protein
MSLSCGFAMDSTVPEMRRVPIVSWRCMNFRQPAVRIALPIANRSGRLQCTNRRLRSVAPLLAVMAAVRLHLPFGPEAFWVLLALSDETR